VTPTSEKFIFDYIITIPGYPRRVEGRKAIAELYRPYGTMIVPERCHDLAVHHDIKTGVVVLEYACAGRVVSTGAPYSNRYISVLTSPIARSLTGATTSTPWRSSTRSAGRHVDGRRKRSGSSDSAARHPEPRSGQVQRWRTAPTRQLSSVDDATDCRRPTWRTSFVNPWKGLGRPELVPDVRTYHR
jgi:hypothetical protein